MLGLCRRAGALFCGTYAVEAGVRKGKVLLVVADEALSERSQSQLRQLCQKCSTAFLLAGPEGRVGQAIGKQSKVVGITKQAFSQRLQEIFLQAQSRGGVTI